MGDVADMMLDGEMCETCGDHLGDGDGFPRRCSACRRDESREPVFRATSPDYDAFAKERRWLTAAARVQGVTADAAPSYLDKLAKRGFVYYDNLERRYFITDIGRAELERIGVISASVSKPTSGA